MVLAILLALLPSAWLLRVAVFHLPLVSEPASTHAMLTLACRKLPEQRIWLSTADTNGRFYCSQALALSSEEAVHEARAVVARSRTPSFFIFESLIECRSRRSGGVGEDEVTCASYTNAL